MERLIHWAVPGHPTEVCEKKACLRENPNKSDYIADPGVKKRKNPGLRRSFCNLALAALLNSAV